MKKLILVGGGGHARACLDVIASHGGYAVEGILDMPGAAGCDAFGVPVIGTDGDIPRFAASGASFLVCVGQIADPEPRMRLHALLTASDARLETIVAPTAHVSAQASLGPGTIVMHFAHVGPGARIGANCIVNNQALVEHDAEVADHCHVSTGALVNGGCVLGEGVFVGSGAVLKQYIRIGKRAVIGMGAAVRHDVAEGEVVR